MEEVLPSSAKQFLERFQDFYDSVIRSVKISFGRTQDRRATGVARGVVVLLDVQDQTVAENDEIRSMMDTNAAVEDDAQQRPAPG